MFVRVGTMPAITIARDPYVAWKYEKTYYFCVEMCQTKFEKDPMKFTNVNKLLAVAHARPWLMKLIVFFAVFINSRYNCGELSSFV